MKSNSPTIAELKTMRFLQLRELSDTRYLKPDLEQAVLKELAMRNILGQSVECGLRELKRLISECNKRFNAEFLKDVVSECISREEAGNCRRGLVKPLYAAKKKLEAQS